MAKRFIGVGCIKRRHQYTLTLFNTADEVVARGKLKETGWGALELENEEEMKAICSGNIGYAVVKRYGEAEWIMPWRTMRIITGREISLGDTITFHGIEEGES